MRRLASLIAITVLATACGGDDSVPSTLEGSAAAIHSGDCTPDTGGSITVWSGRSEDLIQPIVDAFACAEGIEVRMNYGDPTDLALALAEEGDRTQADVFLSKSPGAVGFLSAEGLLQELDSDLLDEVDSGNKAGDGTWVGISGRQRVLVYNLDNVSDDELPSSVFDLTGETYRGRVAIPATNGSFLDWFTVFRAQEGDDVATQWLADMVANDAIVTESNRPTVDAVGRGEFDFGLVNHYYNFQEAAAIGPDHRAENHVFDGDDIGSLVIVTAGGITASSDAVDDSQAFLSFLLGEGAQQFITDDTLEYPLSAGVDPNDVLPDLDDSGSDFDVDFDSLGDGLARSVEIIEASGITG